MTDPILATKELPAPAEGYPFAATLTAEGGLRYSKGNSAPHFCLTGDLRGKRQWACGGMIHDILLKHFPHLADLAALHMADVDGVPLHVEGNGWYWLAGALGGLGMAYHGGNCANVPKDAAECLAIVASHLRIDAAEAERLAAEIEALPAEQQRPTFGAYIEAQRPRWKAEADACRERHGLIIYGDAYTNREQ